MKRIISALLMIVLLVSLLNSCGEKNREYDKDTVIMEAEELIKKSEILNEVFWGEGLNYVEDLNYSEGYYYMANPIEASKLGFETVSDMLRAAEQTYSESYVKTIRETVFEGVKYESSVLSYARYYQKYEYDENFNPIAEECIMVNSRAYVTFTSDVKYLYETLTDVGSEGEVVYVKLSAEVTRKSDGKTQIREIKIGLIEEADGFRIHTPTFINYYDESEL